MSDTFKTVVIAAVMGSMMMLGGALVGNNQPLNVDVSVPDSAGLSGVTNYDELSLQDASGTTTLTLTSATLGGCLAIEQADGSGSGFFFVDSTGSWATSTSCE